MSNYFYNTIWICIFILVCTNIADLAIGFEHYNVSCRNDLFEFSPVQWLLTNGFLGLIWILSFCLVYLDRSYRKIYALPYLFSWLWTILGMIMVWSRNDNLDCHPHGVRDMLWTSLIVNVCVGFIVTVCLILIYCIDDETNYCNHNDEDEHEQPEQQISGITRVIDFHSNHTYRIEEVEGERM